MTENSKQNIYSEESQTIGANESRGAFEIAGHSSVENFTKNGLSLIVEATKAVNGFPTGAARDLYCAYPTFGKVIDTQSDRIMGIISKVLKKQNVRGNIQRRQKDERFEMLLECNDLMLERINSNLDDLAGIKKQPQTILIESKIAVSVAPQLDTDAKGAKGSASWNVQSKSTQDSQIRTARLITAKNIARPQINFKTPIDNSPLSPFEPKLKEKPNSLKPLAILPEYAEDGSIESYLHPYEFELSKFVPPAAQLKESEPIAPKKIEDTPLEYVDTEEQLKKLLTDLQHEKEIAVDLEHHSYRTFMGITCLMQISTRQKDYIVDTLKLREELYILNEVLTNPKILKIFHGADKDIEWLQRDLSLYVVNLFDTHQAAKLLSLSRLSLSYILKYYCNIEADKTFQLADWRIRPLPAELILYARQDTHFLIYMYERIRNDILAQPNGVNILKAVYQKSTEICQKRYVKPKIDPDSHMDLYLKSKRIFDNRQLFALKHLFTWRDHIARQEDESIGYVLPNHMMLQISESLPREMQGILACCNPIPPLVRQNLHPIHQIILKAREQPLVKPIIEEQIENRAIVSTAKDYNNKLYCPHDLTQNLEFRDDLPTLLGPVKLVDDVDEDCKIDEPVISVFETVTKAENKNEEIKQKLLKLKNVKFVTPYERYKAILPLAERKRLEEIARQEEINKTRLLCPVKIESKDVDDRTASIKEDERYTLPKKQSLKREHENVDNNELEEPETKKSKKHKNKRKRDRRNKKETESCPDTEEPVASNDVEEKWSEETPNEETPNVEEPNINNPFLSKKPRKSNNFKKYKGTHAQGSNKTAQGSNEVVQFDYTKVDFKKFQGGAGKAKATQIQTTFNGKGKSNKANKKMNKLFTFTNAKNKK